MLDLAGVQKVIWDNYGKYPTDDNTFFYGNGNEKYEELGTEFSIHKGTISAVKRVNLFSDTYYIVPSRCCDDIFLNVHSPS
jgi:hypothetical protein